MTQTADVVVIGGGVNGVSIAYALAGRGVRVVLVEKGALAGGASGRSSALVRMHYTNEWDARLAWASFPVFRNWPELMGGPPVFTHTGFVNVVGPAHVENLRRNVAMLQGIGVPTRAITPDELRALQPFARVDDVGAAPRCSRIAPRPWSAPPWPAAIAPSTATARTVTPSWVESTGSTGSTWPPPSAAPASRSRLPSARAWPS